MNTREFIKSLGENAAEFFDVKPETIARWLKTGNVPVKAADKIFMAMNASKLAVVESSQPITVNSPGINPPSPQVVVETKVDPVTHLPTGMSAKLPDIQVAGQKPAIIETDPREQSWGNNLTRPGRRDAQPLPPMKLRRREDGQVEAYVDTQPAPPVVIPPTINANAGWGRPMEVKDDSSTKK